ncbi:MAG TPA: cytochrome P450 [Roseiflexaceae bacterium]|nr:cytochrome P450 [Roseiflexaceae bacterium]
MTKALADLPAVEWTGAEIMSGEFPRRLAEAAVRLGPIFKWVIRDNWDAGEYVFMVGPEANRFVLHTGRTHFSHDQGWTPLIGDTLGKGLLNMDDPEHARHRKMWNPAFTAAAMESYVPVIQRVIAERTSRWPAADSVDVYAEAREITFDIAAAALGGFQPGAEIDRLRSLFYVILHGFDGTVEPWDTFENRFSSALEELRTTLLNLITQRRALPESEQPRDVVGMIVRARDDEGRALSDEQVLAHINILLVAGHETTTTLGAWVLYLLATHPNERRLVEAELVRLLGDTTQPTSVEALRSMKYLDAFIREAGRLYSPVINVPRGVLSDYEFGGYTIPAGTPVRLSLAGAHRLPGVFHEPEQFDPSRFLPPRDEERRTPYGLVTFGGGPRICIGINFAQIEVKALAAHVLRNYVLEAAGPPSPHAGHWNASLPTGLRLRVRPR